jgi:hypothetical protein
MKLNCLLDDLQVFSLWTILYRLCFIDKALILSLSKIGGGKNWLGCDN